MPTLSIELRPATDADCKRVWDYNNDSDVRAVSASGEPIPLATHRRWFARCLATRTIVMRIIVVDGEPAGVVRIEVVQASRDPVISVALAAQNRGQGVGRRAVRLACEEYGRDHLETNIVARIRDDNEASMRCFEAVGFELHSTETAGERQWRIYRRKPG